MIERYHPISHVVMCLVNRRHANALCGISKKEAQVEAFTAAQIGVPCEEVDLAARRVLKQLVWGLATKHRFCHIVQATALGLIFTNGPISVKGNKTPLAKGMCFSNEPMICLDGEFGIRLEDHFYMTGKAALVHRTKSCG